MLIDLRPSAGLWNGSKIILLMTKIQNMMDMFKVAKDQSDTLGDSQNLEYPQAASYHKAGAKRSPKASSRKETS